MYFCSVLKYNMMPSFEESYREAEANVNKAVAVFKELKSERKALLEENRRLKGELDETKRQLEETREKLKLIELTNTTLSREDKRELKKQINLWVREIDESIRLLGGR